MGIFNWRKSRDHPKRSQNMQDFVKGVDLDTGQTSSGINVDEENALKISAVYACVKVISETVASLPFNLLKEETNGDMNKAKQLKVFIIIVEF